MCKLERTNDIKKTCVVSTLKKLKILKLENAYLLYLIFWLKLFIHQNLKFSNVLMKLQPLSEGFKKKRNLFQYNFDYKHLFIMKYYTNHIRQLCIGKDQLILVKYELNFTKAEN